MRNNTSDFSNSLSPSLALLLTFLKLKKKKNATFPVKNSVNCGWIPFTYCTMFLFICINRALKCN